MNSEFEHMREEEIMRFVRGEMGPEELNAFEEQIKSDSLLKEEVALQRSVYNSLNENEWDTSEMSTTEEIEELKNVLNEPGLKRASETIKQVGNTYASMDTSELKTSKKTYKWLAMAATLLLLLTIPFLLKNQDKDFYTTYEDWNALPSFVEKGSSQNSLALAEELYKKDKFEETIAHLKENIDAESTLYPASLIYLGAAYFKSQNSAKALAVFDQLVDTKTLYSSYGYWYKLLIYLQKNDQTNAQKMLDVILTSPDNYNFKKAEEINASF